MASFSDRSIDLGDPPKPRYRVFEIPKKRGRTRRIYSPYGAYKRWLTTASRKLTLLAWENQPGPWMDKVEEMRELRSEGRDEEADALLLGTYALCPCHGFMPGRNPVTAAIPHIGYEFTLSIDLEDFFDSVSKHYVDTALRGFRDLPTLPYQYRTPLFPGKYARQGLPTSPALANIAAYPMDLMILEYAKERNLVYTRYADDLSISFDGKDRRLDIRKEILELVKQADWQVNEAKTRLQWAGKDGTWTREVVGVGVNNERVLPLKGSRKKLRGLNHRLQFVPPEKVGGTRLERVAKGMAEWISCKRPSDDGGLYVFTAKMEGMV